MGNTESSERDEPSSAKGFEASVADAEAQDSSVFNLLGNRKPVLAELLDELQAIALSAPLREADWSRLSRIKALERMLALLLLCDAPTIDAFCNWDHFLPLVRQLVSLQSGRDTELQRLSCRILWIILAGGNQQWTSEALPPFGIKGKPTLSHATFARIDKYLFTQCQYPYPLVHLILSSDPVIAKHAVACLCLIQSRNNPAWLHKGEAMLDTIAETLSNNILSLDHDLQLVSLSSLISISSILSTHETLVNSSIIENLVSLLHRPASSLAVISAAALCLRLLVQRSPFLCYKKLENKLPNGHRVITSLMMRADAYFQEYPALCHGVSSSSVVDILVVLTVATRAETLLRLMQVESAKLVPGGVIGLALRSYRTTQTKHAAFPKLRHFKLVLSQLLLHLAMLEDCLPVLLEQGLEQTPYSVIRESCSHMEPYKYLEMHATENEILQRRSRHFMYKCRVFARMAEYLVGLPDSKAIKMRLSVTMMDVIFPEVCSPLEQKDWFPGVSTSTPQQKSTTLSYASIEASLSALSQLSLRHEWMEALFRARPAVFSSVVRGASQAAQVCRRFESIYNEVQTIPENELSLAGHASVILHLATCALSNVTMYPGLLANQRELLVSMWSFFSSSTYKGPIDFEVPETFLLATHPNLPQRSEAVGNEQPGDISDNVALHAAFVEGCLGKANIQLCFPKLFVNHSASSQGTRGRRHSFASSTDSSRSDTFEEGDVNTAVDWVRFSRRVLGQYNDPLIVSKCFSLETHALQLFGWPSIWGSMQQHPHETKEENSFPIDAEPELWDELFIQTLVNIVEKEISSTRPSCVALLREASQLLLELSSAQGFEREFELALNLKFKHSNHLESDTAGVQGVPSTSQEAILASTTRILGSPVHPQNLETQDEEQDIVIGSKCPWGILFRQAQDGVLVKNGKLSFSSGWSETHEMLPQTGWTISFWARSIHTRSNNHVNHNGSDNTASLPFNPKVRTLVYASSGDHPVALLETPDGLELGCLEWRRTVSTEETDKKKKKKNEQQKKEGERGLFSWTNSGKESQDKVEAEFELVWHGCGVALDRLEPGWHHICVYGDGKETIFFVDRSPQGEHVPFCVSACAIEMIGNSKSMESPFHPDWIIADLRVYRKPIPLSILGGTPGRVALNRRPWDASNVWGVVHEWSRQRMGAQVSGLMVKLLLQDLAEVHVFAALLFLNLTCRRDILFRLVSHGGVKAAIRIGHVTARHDAQRVESRFILERKDFARVILKYAMAKML